LLSRALRHYAGESVIVYSPTIRRVEETVEYLEESGIAAIPYHAKMESSMRRQNQETMDVGRSAWCWWERSPLGWASTNRRCGR